MTRVPDDAAGHQEPTGWYALPEVAALLGVRDRDVRGMVRDRRLLAVPHGPNGARMVPADFLLDADDPEAPGPLPNLRGTLVVLADAGYDEEESFRWLFTLHDELDGTPVEALRGRRTHAVRRAAQTLGF